MLILEIVPTGSKPQVFIHKHLHGCLGEFNNKKCQYHAALHWPIVHSFIVWVRQLMEMYQ